MVWWRVHYRAFPKGGHRAQRDQRLDRVKHRSVQTLMVVAITHVLASNAQANDIQGTCFCDSEKLP